MFVQILILVILIGLNAFFAASEIAFISLNDNKIEDITYKLSEKDDGLWIQDLQKF